MSKVRYKYNSLTQNIKIINSTKLKTKKEINEFLNTVPLNLVKRTKKSAINEWIAHNRLYQLGLFKNHTRDCDLTKNESLLRRFCYWVLSRCAK